MSLRTWPSSLDGAAVDHQLDQDPTCCDRHPPFPSRSLRAPPAGKPYLSLLRCFLIFVCTTSRRRPFTSEFLSAGFYPVIAIPPRQSSVIASGEEGRWEGICHDFGGPLPSFLSLLFYRAVVASRLHKLRWMGGRHVWLR